MTLHIKGLGHIDASKDVIQQWHEGEGVHFACRIHFLAHHYQLFEQLPIKKQGGDRGHSLLNNEQIQAAVRAYLSSLAVGDVTAKTATPLSRDSKLSDAHLELLKRREGEEECH
jgi:hypothetical protein